MKVVQVLTRFGGGGPPLTVVNLHRMMRRTGCEMTLVYGECEPNEIDMTYLLEPTDTVIRVGTMRRSINALLDIQSLFSLWLIMRRIRPDVVHTHTAKAGVLGRMAALLAGVPRIVHTYHGNVFEGYFSSIVSWGIVQLERILSLGTDVVITLSAEQAAEVTDRFRIASRSRVVIVPLALELVQKVSSSGETIGDTAWRERGWVVGWLGRCVPIKNLTLLSGVFMKILERWPDAVCVAAGDGPQRDLLEAVAERFGRERMKILGWVDNPESVVAACDVIVLTSRNEGTPVCILQGMSQGIPCVSTLVGGVEDLFGNVQREDAGFKVHDRGVSCDHSSEAFIRALEFLRADRGESLNKVEVSDWVHEVYGLPAILKRIGQIYGLPSADN